MQGRPIIQMSTREEERTSPSLINSSPRPSTKTPSPTTSSNKRGNSTSLTLFPAFYLVLTSGALAALLGRGASGSRARLAHSSSAGRAHSRDRRTRGGGRSRSRSSRALGTTIASGNSGTGVGIAGRNRVVEVEQEAGVGGIVRAGEGNQLAAGVDGAGAARHVELRARNVQLRATDGAGAVQSNVLHTEEVLA